jgi:hypothetical protein
MVLETLTSVDVANGMDSGLPHGTDTERVANGMDTERVGTLDRIGQFTSQNWTIY